MPNQGHGFGFLGQEALSRGVPAQCGTHFPSEPALAAKDLGLGGLRHLAGVMLGFLLLLPCAHASPKVGRFQGGRGKVELLLGTMCTLCALCHDGINPRLGGGNKGNKEEGLKRGNTAADIESKAIHHELVGPDGCS